MHTEPHHSHPPRDPDDRRKTLQRDEDVERAIAVEHKSAYEAWGALMILRKSPVIVWATMIASCITFLLTNLGFRILGPQQDLKALDAKLSRSDSTMNVRMVRVEQTLVLRAAGQDSVRAELRFLSYVLCVQARRMDPSSAPPGCDPIIERKGQP